MRLRIRGYKNDQEMEYHFPCHNVGWGCLVCGPRPRSRREDLQGRNCRYAVRAECSFVEPIPQGNDANEARDQNRCLWRSAGITKSGSGEVTTSRNTIQEPVRSCARYPAQKRTRILLACGEGPVKGARRAFILTLDRPEPFHRIAEGTKRNEVQ